MAQAPPRIPTLMLKTQKYDIVVKWVPGKTLYIADALSRSALLNDKTTNDGELNIHTVENMPISSERLKQFHEETDKDQTLQCQHIV